MRIAAVVYENMTSSMYRSLFPMQALAERGHTVHIEERMEVANPAALLDFDVVHFCRSCHRSMQVIARRLRGSGVATIWDNDDDVRTIPAQHATHAPLRGTPGKRIFSAMTAMMKTVDVVTTPSAELARRYRAASGADVHVLENYLPPTFERPARVMPHGSAIRIGWLASGEHVDDYRRLGLQETLEHLLQRYQHLEIVAIGLDLGLASQRYTHVPFTRYDELAPILSRLDIGIAPLAGIEFNAIRSNVKLKEYAAVGLPWLASPIGPYAEMGEQEGGRLVPDDRWQAELEALVSDDDERRRLAFRARRWAEGETIEQHVDDWEELFTRAAERAGARKAVRR